jgi:hypothetical protein
MGGGAPVLIRSTVSQTLRLLRITPHRHTVMLWGPPGIGKTDLVRQYAASRDADLVVIRASEMEPQDLIGLPDMAGDFTVFKPLRYLWELTKEAEAQRAAGSGGAEDPRSSHIAAERTPDFHTRSGTGPVPRPTNAVLFLDELSNAPPHMVATLQYLILNRTVGFGGLELADGVQIIAAGNREGDGAFTTSLSTAVRSRLKHIELEPSLAEWQRWARTNGVYPTIVAFLSRRARFFHDFDPLRTEHTFPCPRTWTLLGESLKLADERGETDPLLRRVNAEAYVGPAAAVEYGRFEETAIHCPSADDIVADPLGTPTFTNRPDKALVCVENLIAACRLEPDRFVDGALRYVARLHAEYQTLFHSVIMNLHGDMPEPVLHAAFESEHFETIARNVGRMSDVLTAARAGRA